MGFEHPRLGVNKQEPRIIHSDSLGTDRHVTGRSATDVLLAGGGLCDNGSHESGHFLAGIWCSSIKRRLRILGPADSSPSWKVCSTARKLLRASVDRGSADQALGGRLPISTRDEVRDN